MNFAVHSRIVELTAECEALHWAAHNEPNKRKAGALRRKAKRCEADANVYRARMMLEAVGVEF